MDKYWQDKDSTAAQQLDPEVEAVVRRNLKRYREDAESTEKWAASGFVSWSEEEQ